MIIDMIMILGIVNGQEMARIAFDLCLQLPFDIGSSAH